MQHVISPRQFIVQTKLFSEVSPKFPDDNTLKVYLYICRNYDWKFDNMHTAKSVIQSDLAIGYRELTRILQWLEDNHFIQRCNPNKHQMYQAKILIAPDFDAKSNQYIGYEETISTYNLKSSNTNYASIPNDVLRNEYLSVGVLEGDWGAKKLSVLIMLYRHCWLDYFGGVNPDIIAVDVYGNIVSVNQSFYYSLKMTEREVISNIKQLMKEGFFQPVSVWFERKYHQNIYAGDSDCISATNNLNQQFVLRPKYISQSKFEKVQKIIGEGKMHFEYW